MYMYLLFIASVSGANIFLLDGCVKLGDFGLSIQLHNIDQTAPQEVKDQRGTIRGLHPFHLHIHVHTNVHVNTHIHVYMYIH